MRILRTTFLLCAGATIAWTYRYRNEHPYASEQTAVSVLHHASEQLQASLPQAGPQIQTLLPQGRGSTDFAHAAEEREQIFFSPSQNLERVDVGLIEHAHSSIKVAMYAFTDRNIAEALARQASRGVKVWVYRDREQFEQERMRRSPVAEILASQRNIHLRVKGTNELMHEKAVLIDDAILRDGSGNWSVSAARYQDNQVTVTKDAGQVAAFDRNFEEMWNRRDNLVVP
jgi:phosphatidylserine/phosphatidylglycerophosphate/cardiolipin synthase-like enzyme